jgi:hypothetical protein
MKPFLIAAGVMLVLFLGAILYFVLIFAINGGDG